jgi:hypothetical protein
MEKIKVEKIYTVRMTHEELSFLLMHMDAFEYPEDKNRENTRLNLQKDLRGIFERKDKEVMS